MLKIDPEVISNRLIAGIKKYFEKAGFNKAVIGISGGLDSAVAAALAVKVLGNENVTGIKLPYKSSSLSSINDANILIDFLQIKSMEIDITDAVDTFSEPDISPLRLGNIMARARMVYLFDRAASLNSLVLGTSNRSELLLGYGTLFGDLASIVNPLGKLYKTQVYQLAEYFRIPEKIIKKAPSADLEEGQSDEKDFGFTYKDADRIMNLIFDHGVSEIEAIGETGNADLVRNILRRVKNNRFKAEIPHILSIS